MSDLHDVFQKKNQNKPTPQLPPHPTHIMNKVNFILTMQHNHFCLPLLQEGAVRRGTPAALSAAVSDSLFPLIFPCNLGTVHRIYISLFGV